MKKLLLGLLLLAIVVGGVTVWWFTAGTSGVPNSASSDGPTPARDDHFTIVWAGDTMLGWNADKMIKRKGYDHILGRLEPLLDADYVVINLEAPVTTLTREDMPEKHRKWTYHIKPAALKAFEEMGVDAYSLANNHLYDRGQDGVFDTFAHSEEHGLKFFGAGMTREEAEAPLLIETPHGTVGVVGFSHRGPRLKEAKEDQPGLVYLYAEQMKRSHRAARKAGADIVVGFPHWGINYEVLRPQEMRVAEQFSKMGYDLVIGQGPHVQQPVGQFGDMPVVYSLGNFVFSTQGRFQKLGDKDPYGLIAKTFIGPTGVERIELRCILIDNLRVKYRPRMCNAEERADSFAKLGLGVVVEGDAAVVVF
ncbi:MAG: CapA family protein [Deltaproteobacteria bacterium]|nr:CapA family protein [Deltaproteobacteria bacterium]